MANAAQSSAEKLNRQKCLSIAFIFHLAAAFFSSGFYHADEHFQISEFVHFKLRLTPVEDLPLEFHQQMRPWLFPAFLTFITHILQLLGMNQPFVWAFAYRLISSLIGWTTSAWLVQCSDEWFLERRWKKMSIFLILFLWFIPAFHARPSSENISSSLFFLGLSFLFLNSRSIPPENPIPGLSLSGILLGFAFHCRYQTALLSIGAIAWFFVIERRPFKQLMPLFYGAGFALFFGLLIDQWGYGITLDQTPVFPPWNYLKYNLIDQHLSDSDTSGILDYFRRSFTESWPLLGSLLLVTSLLGIILHPQHLLSWSCLPFVLFHLFIGHKELRFLFPILPVSGILATLTVSTLYQRSKKVFSTSFRKKKKFQGTARFFIGSLICWNSLGLVILTFIPAWAPIRFYENLWKVADRTPRPFHLYYADDRFFNFGGAIMHFYRPRSALFTPISREDFQSLLNKKDETSDLFFFSSLPGQSPSKNHCHIELTTLPSFLWDWVQRLSLPHLSNWTLHRCSRLKD